METRGTGWTLTGTVGIAVVGGVVTLYFLLFDPAIGLLLKR